MNTLQYYQKVETYLRRTVDFTKEVRLVSDINFDDNGAYSGITIAIEEWNCTDKPKPTQEQLDAITEYIDPRAAELARAERDKLIAETDWTQVADAQLSDDKKEAYKLYRQALRDVPEQDGFPYKIDWPEKP